MLGVLWVLYCAVHSLLAGLRVKAYFEKRLGKAFRHYRLAYTVFAFVSLVLILWYQLALRSFYLFSPTSVSDVAGAVVAISGLLLMAVCIKKYFLNLSGLKSLVREETKPLLVITGVHRYMRHPLYLGTFLFIWGLFGLFPSASLMISNIIITVYTLLALEWEEQKLLHQFGDRYRKYQKRVPKLIPRL